jgi:hypothetical protein
MRSGLSVAVSAVTRLGTQYEKDYMLEVGLWPYKSKHSRLWLSVMVSGEGRSDWLKTWGLKLPTIEGKFNEFAQWIVRCILPRETPDV